MANPSIDCWGARDRLERWRHVRHLLDRAELGAGRLRQECLQAAASELLLLAADEALWDYPSVSRVAELRQIIADADLVTAAAAAREIVGMLERT